MQVNNLKLLIIVFSDWGSTLLLNNSLLGDLSIIGELGPVGRKPLAMHIHNLTKCRPLTASPLAYFFAFKVVVSCLEGH